MFRFSGFTQKANNAINVAMAQASLLGHTYVGSEHLILGMLDENSGVAYVALTERNITFERYRGEIKATVGSGSKTTLTPEDFTPRCKKALELAVIKARMLGQGSVGTEHILMVIARESDSYGVKLLRELGADPEKIADNLQQSVQAERAESGGLERLARSAVKAPPHIATHTPTLDKYGRDLTEQAREGRLDPLLCREKEVSRVIQVLSRRTKNNPCLIGEAGVGKTAIVEGLAQRMARGEAPETLLGKRLVALDLTSMVAGAKYRGDFEDRIKNAIEEVIRGQDVVLFIDEIHTIMGAGAAEGAIDAANILKPQLARGDLQVIGATTSGEYRKHIEKDAALERRFQSVMVEEPSERDAVEILKGLRGRYEEHHRVGISDEAIEAAVRLSARYLPDRFLPDKAIDLIDEAASRARLGCIAPPVDLSEVEGRLLELQGEKEDAINLQDFELAASIRDREKSLRGRLHELRSDWKPEPPQRQEVGGQEVAELVAEITGVDVTALTEEQSERLLRLEKELHRRVVGQEKAVVAVSAAIRRGKVGLGDPGRPIGSFLFLGPTGVGKTALCLALAESLFSKKDSLIRLDMSEYMEKHAVAKLIGAPPGYVGYEEGGQLTEKARRRPYSVILFDEIEKAHPDVQGILLQILDDGALTDSQGRRVSLKNTVIVMTSNAGARHITERRSFGFSPASGAEEENRDMEKDVMGEVKKTFRPEFLGRVDEVVVFRKLGAAEIKEIARKTFEKLAARMAERGVALSFTEAAEEQAAKEGFDSLYGARPLRRVIRRRIEEKLAGEILGGVVKAGDRVVCDYRGEEFVFSKEP